MAALRDRAVLTTPAGFSCIVSEGKALEVLRSAVPGPQA
jgi:hypothetical protein